MSLSYIMIGSNDVARSRIFYDAIIAQIGGVIDADYAGYAFCYRLRGEARVWVGLPNNKEAAVPGNGSMPGFHAGTNEAVDAAYAAALANGGTCEGPAGPRPDYGPDFYGAYVRDPDGNKMSFVCFPF